MLSTLVLIGEAVVLLYKVENFVTLLNPHSSGTKFTTLMINSSSNSVLGVSQFKVVHLQPICITAAMLYRMAPMTKDCYDRYKFGRHNQLKLPLTLVANMIPGCSGLANPQSS